MQAALVKMPRLLQRLEGAQRIRVVLAAVVDARQARPLDEIVGQDLLPQVDHFLRLREEAMPADVEHEAVVFDRAADAADIHRVLLDHDDRGVLLGEAVGGGEAGRPCADHEDVGMDAHRETLREGEQAVAVVGNERARDGAGDQRGLRQRGEHGQHQRGEHRVARALRGGGHGGVAHRLVVLAPA